MLAKAGPHTLTTTHLREIKEFGRVTAGCAIAGMGFDCQTLAPTYQLTYGTLGESHALEIAARAGLPAAVVARARQLVGGSWVEPESAPALAPPLPLPAEPAQAAAQAPATPRPTVSLVLAAATHGRCRVWHEGAEQELSVLDTLLRRLPAGLVVGDHVRVREGKVIEAANRQNVLVSRNADTGLESVVAANVTRMAIVVSARQPDFHATMLARHLFYAERQGVTPLICLTKGDLVAVAAGDEWLKPFRDLGYQSLVVSVVKARGLDALRAALAGQVTAVIGYPGAGKSTLLAAVAGGEPSSLRAAPLGTDGWLVNLPSLRELGVWKPDLSTSFREFGAHAGPCKAAGCLHRQETGWRWTWVIWSAGGMSSTCSSCTRCGWGRSLHGHHVGKDQPPDRPWRIRGQRPICGIRHQPLVLLDLQPVLRVAVPQRDLDLAGRMKPSSTSGCTFRKGRRPSTRTSGQRVGCSG